MKNAIDTVTKLANSGNSPSVLLGISVSIILGIILICASLYMKKVNNQWWGLINGIGLLSIIVNVFRLL